MKKSFAVAFLLLIISVPQAKACSAFCVFGICWQVQECPAGTSPRCYCASGHPVCGCFPNGGGGGCTSGDFMLPSETEGCPESGARSDQPFVLDDIILEKAAKLHPESVRLLQSLSEEEVREMILTGRVLNDTGSVLFTLEFPYVEIIVETANGDRLMIGREGFDQEVIIQ